MICLEVSRKTVDGRDRLTFVLSIPGREGTVTRQWTSLGALLEPAQLEDFMASVDQTLWDWLLIAGGAQMPLAFCGEPPVVSRREL